MDKAGEANGCYNVRTVVYKFPALLFIKASQCLKGDLYCAVTFVFFFYLIFGDFVEIMLSKTRS